jgi:lipid-A-disaccharide synthase
MSKPGTVTLELALLRVPTIIVYTTSWITYLIARSLIKVRWMGLPNLLLQRTMFPEFIQHHCTSKRIINEVIQLYGQFLQQKKEYETILDDCEKIRTLLGR